MEKKKRLIDANALKDWFLHCVVRMDAEAIAERIDKAPTVDAVEVVYGRWIDRGYEVECPFCGFTCNDTHYLGKAIACPNCAATMDA